MQDKYDGTAIEQATQAEWSARDAYRVSENATNAQGQAKPK